MNKIEEAYGHVEKEKSLFQSELWRRLDVSSREGSRIARQMEEQGLVERKKELHDGRWTYLLIPKHTTKGLETIEDIFCLNCPYEPRCSYDSPRYLIECEYIENWALEQFSLKHHNSKANEQ
jgi:DNA-binding MarR family transcriptional regulator